MGRSDVRQVSNGTLSLFASVEGERTVLRIVGELDLANSAMLESELARAEREQGRVVLDMRELEFIDSTGIALLVAAHRRLNCDGRERRFAVVPSSRHAVQSVLGLTGVDVLLPRVDPPLSAV
jgi:anti-sigma B factor antagonist